jgi:hypothetical protein
MSKTSNNDNDSPHFSCIMALISSSLLIGMLSFFHLTIAWLFLTSPSTLSTHSLVAILGASLNLPPAVPTHFSASSAFSSASASVLSTPNGCTALLAVVFAYFAVSDIVAAGLRVEVYHEFWGAQSPMRLAVLFVLESWIYLTKPGDGLFASKQTARGKGGMGEFLRNDLVFTWAFVELVAMFWVCFLDWYHVN